MDRMECACRHCRLQVWLEWTEWSVHADTVDFRCGQNRVGACRQCGHQVWSGWSMYADTIDFRQMLQKVEGRWGKEGEGMGS